MQVLHFDLNLYLMESFENERLLIVAPHPDDEILGCGGLIARVKRDGGKVFVLFLTVGDTQDYSKTGLSTQSQRLEEIKNVADFFRFDGWKVSFKGELYHLKLDQVPQKELIDEIENGVDISLNSINPTIVAVTSENDYNQDHRAAARAVYTAVRPAPNSVKSFQKIVLSYESVMTAQWWKDESTTPNFFINISEKEVNLKIKALKLYKTQIRFGAHPRSAESIKSFAKYRGIFAGSQFAEGYFLKRFVK